MSRMNLGDMPLDYARKNAARKKMLDPRVAGFAGEPDFTGPPVQRTVSAAEPTATTVAPQPLGATRTISAIPSGPTPDQQFTEQDVRNELRAKQNLRARIIQRALTTNDPAEREALINQRHDLERDIRPLGEVLPKTFANPGPEQEAAHERLQADLRSALARRNAMQQAAPHTTEPEAALSVGQEMARGTGADIPMRDPTDELRRQEMLRLGAREPMLAGSGTDAYLTTRAMQEKARRNMVPSAESASPDAGNLPPMDSERANRDFQQAKARQEGYQPEAANILSRARLEREFRDKLSAGEMRKQQAQQEADVAMEEARALAAKRAAGRTLPVDTTGSTGTATETIQKGVPERTGGIRGLLGGEGVSPTVSLFLAGTPLGPAFALLNRWALGGESDVKPEQLDLAFRDLETTAPNLSLEQRTELSKNLRSIRNQIAGQSGATKWVDRIQGILAQIEPGA